MGTWGPSESHRLMYVLRSKEIDLSERRSNAPPSSLLPAPWFRMWRGSIWESLRRSTELTCHGYWVPQRLLVHTSNIHPYIHGKDDSILVCARVFEVSSQSMILLVYWFSIPECNNVRSTSLFDWLLGSLIICSKVNLCRIKRPTAWCPRYFCCFRHPTNQLFFFQKISMYIYIYLLIFDLFILNYILDIRLYIYIYIYIYIL